MVILSNKLSTRCPDDVTRYNRPVKVISALNWAALSHLTKFCFLRKRERSNVCARQTAGPDAAAPAVGQTGHHPRAAAGRAAAGDAQSDLSPCCGGCGEAFPQSRRRAAPRSRTCRNFMATSRKPFCSNRLMISPTSPRWTPSGLMAMKVRSQLAAIALRGRGTRRRERPRRLPHPSALLPPPPPQGRSRRRPPPPWRRPGPRGSGLALGLPRARPRSARGAPLPPRPSRPHRRPRRSLRRGPQAATAPEAEAARPP